jgi:hypothetical protein
VDIRARPRALDNSNFVFSSVPIFSDQADCKTAESKSRRRRLLKLASNASVESYPATTRVRHVGLLYGENVCAYRCSRASASERPDFVPLLQSAQATHTVA